MAAYNGEKYIRQCMESLLNQQFGDFELLIINDASTDGSVSVIESFNDPRIRLEHNERNLGLAVTLNCGLDMIDTEFVARMDCDDLCPPDRFQKQVDYLTAHPDIGVVGMWMKAFGNPKMEGLVRCPTGSECIKAYMLFGNPISHPTVMMRTAFLNQHELRYDPVYNRTEDMDLWQRAADCFPLENIPVVGLYWRNHVGSVTLSHGSVMENQHDTLLKRQLRKIGLNATDEEMQLHRKIGLGRRMFSIEEMAEAQDWMTRIHEMALQSGFYTERGLNKAIGMVWWRLCRNSANLGKDIWRYSRKFAVGDSYVPPQNERFVLVLSFFYHAMLRLAGRGVKA